MFHVYSVRPGGVDWLGQPEIHPFIPKQALYKRVLVPPLSVVYKGLITPTGPMGKIMTELAMSKGEPLQGSGVEMEGTVLTNAGIRRVAGL